MGRALGAQRNLNRRDSRMRLPVLNRRLRFLVGAMVMPNRIAVFAEKVNGGSRGRTRTCGLRVQSAVIVPTQSTLDHWFRDQASNLNFQSQNLAAYQLADLGSYWHRREELNPRGRFWRPLPNH